MNFVGHAVVAGLELDHGAFAFGAMLPDLSRFAGRHAFDPAADARLVAAGVDSHHRVDAAFHDHSAFRRWTAAVVAAMPVPDRGARAAAHVAVELAIDGILLRGDRSGAYDEALQWAAGAVDGGPWQEVVDRMADGGIVAAYASAAGIADRVVSVMERRPRLRRLGVDRADLAGAVAEVLPDIEPAVGDLVVELSRRSG